MYWHYFLRIVHAAKEYERVLGWEGSVAFSPCDGAAWALGNGTVLFYTLAESKR